jgi:hypothetical protein
VVKCPFQVVVAAVEQGARSCRVSAQLTEHRVSESSRSVVRAACGPSGGSCGAAAGGSQRDCDCDSSGKLRGALDAPSCCCSRRAAFILGSPPPMHGCTRRPSPLEGMPNVVILPFPGELPAQQPAEEALAAAAGGGAAGVHGPPALHPGAVHRARRGQQPAAPQVRPTLQQHGPWDHPQAPSLSSGWLHG